jgi:antitoxin CptB
VITGNDRVKKLRWKARRGMKALDVLLESFFENHGQQLAQGGWPQLEDFLAREDDVLFDWISGRDLPSDPNLLRLIETLTHAR